jgi:hypothetical protein
MPENLFVHDSAMPSPGSCLVVVCQSGLWRKKVLFKGEIFLSHNSFKYKWSSVDRENPINDIDIDDTIIIDDGNL